VRVHKSIYKWAPTAPWLAAASEAAMSSVKVPLERRARLMFGPKQSQPQVVQPLSGHTGMRCRRTLATGLQRLGVHLEVTEAVLNHLSGSRAGVVGIYQRHDWADEKRSALDAWSAHLLAAAEGRPIAGKVLPFGRARSGAIRGRDLPRAS
jgi:hypothetical protein